MYMYIRCCDLKYHTLFNFTEKNEGFGLVHIKVRKRVFCPGNRLNFKWFLTKNLIRRVYYSRKSSVCETCHTSSMPFLCHSTYKPFLSQLSFLNVTKLCDTCHTSKMLFFRHSTQPTQLNSTISYLYRHVIPLKCSSYLRKTFLLKLSFQNVTKVCGRCVDVFHNNHED